MRLLICVLLLSGLLVRVSAQASVDQPVTTHTVMIENMVFSPKQLHLKLGDKVIFKNADLVPHTATSEDPKSFDSKALLQDQTWEYQPTKTGTFRYQCSFHPLMKATLVVEQPKAKPDA